MFGPSTILCDNNSQKLSTVYDERIKKTESMPIIINDNVWIGMNCIIMKGVTIVENSIIAAFSLVIKDVPPNSLYGGHPGKLIKKMGV